MSREEVAQAARRLLDGGLEPEDISTDPTEFDPFGWNDEIGELKASEEIEAAPRSTGAKTDGGSATEVESVATDIDLSDEPDTEEVEEISTEPDPSTELRELVKWASEKLEEVENIAPEGRTEHRLSEIKRQRREGAEERIRTAVEPSQDTPRAKRMQESSLTPDDLIELADSYNEETDKALLGERETAPEIVVDENGGVSIE